MTKRADGNAAESLAAAWLERRGLRIVTRNYNCRSGEIDLIAKDGDTLVFVEVRRRRSYAFGGAAESVNRAKQTRILSAARHYLMNKPEQPCRFDVIVLDALDADAIEWLRDAFGA